MPASPGRVPSRQNVVATGFFPLNRAQKRVALAMVAVLMLMSGAWIFAGESQLDRVRRMGGELFSKANKDMSWEDRREAMKALREESEKLGPGEKQRLREEMEKRGLDRLKTESEKEAEKLDRFFKLPKEQQIAEINKDIDEQVERMEKFQKKMEEFKGKRGGGFGGEGRGRGLGGGPDGGRRGPRGPGAGPEGNAIGPDGKPAAGQGKGRFGGRGNESQQVRERRQKNYLDATSPEYRAQKAEYRRLRNEVLLQRGVALPTFGGKRGTRAPI